MQSAFIEVLWFSAALCQGAWAWRIWRQNLARKHPFLLAYLVFTPCLILPSFWLRSLYGTGVVYGWFWVLTQPLFWILTFAVLCELYSRVVGSFKGLRTISEAALRVVVVALGGFYLWMLLGEHSIETWRSFWLAHAHSLFISATVFAGVILLFVRYWYLSVSRNDWVTIVAFSVLVAGEALITPLGDVLGQNVGATGRVVLVILNCCTFGAGAAMFSSEGEVQETSVASPAVEIEATTGMETLNEVLTRMWRR